jgi:oligoribonuclease NrnB/cAMP/cGMP phosphodiesterase (DHH superfamily)
MQTNQAKAAVQTHNIYVLYHAHCTDGTGSKFAAWKKFKYKAKYIAVSYGNPVPEMEPGSEIYILDFAYSREILEGLQKIHKSVIVLDHHKTAEEALKGMCGCHFNMDKSGCVLAWEYFHPNAPVPDLLLDIQDRDLWQFKRPNSKAIHAGLAMLEGSMNKWELAACGPGAYHKVVSDGELLLKRQDLAVASALKGKVQILPMQGYKVGVTNSTDLSSEIGNGICLSENFDVDFAIVYCITASNQVLLSLRSIEDFDVSKVAQVYGGGGHKNASGATVPLKILIDLLEGKL